MTFDQLVYPSYDEPFIAAYGGKFECAFIILHPFLRMPEEIATQVERYPSDAQIHEFGAKCSWAEVASHSGLLTYPRVNHALLTSIGALKREFQDKLAMEALLSMLRLARPIWMPSEGSFNPLLQREYLSIFRQAGGEEIVFVPEFAELDPPDRYPANVREMFHIRRLSVEDLSSGLVRFPYRGSLVAPDTSFVLTVDWDSFFTVFYGARSFVDEAVRSLSIEGFFAEEQTRHTWWRI